MAKNKYFEKIISKLNFFSVHFRFAVFVIFVVFLFYVIMIGIQLFSVLEHTPSAEEIDKKIHAVSIRKDIIKKIDNFIAVRQKENIDLPKKNPFSPYQKGTNDFSGDTPAIFLETPWGNPGVSLSPSPSVSPEITATPAP